MIDQRNRHRMKEALMKPFGDPRPDVERLAMAAVQNRPAHRTATRAVALAAIVLFIALAVSIALAGRLLRPASQIVGSQEQSAAVLEQLRQRPLSLPALWSRWQLSDHAAGHGSRFLQKRSGIRYRALRRSRPDLWPGWPRSYGQARLLLFRDLVERRPIRGPGARSWAETERARADRVRRTSCGWSIHVDR